MKKRKNYIIKWVHSCSNSLCPLWKGDGKCRADECIKGREFVKECERAKG